MINTAAENNKFDYLKAYLKNAPVCLALMRAIECRIMEKVPFCHPILDIGCGDGLFTSILFKNRDFVDCAIDISDSEVDLCYKKGVHREIKVASAEDIPYQDKSFNFVMANDLMAHARNPENILAETWRVLGDGGLFCFTVPTLLPKFHSNLFTEFIKKYANWNILNFFNHNISAYFRMNSIYNFRKWDIMLKDSGFKVVHHKKYASLTAIAVQLMTSFYMCEAVAYKKALGRYIPFPDLHEKIVTPITSWLLKSLYDDGSFEGENYMILARKIS